MHQIVLAAVLVVAVAAPALAGRTDGPTACARDDDLTAAQPFTHLAENGKAWAHFFLGLVCAEGNGVPRDDIRAAH